jgi:hypothetical protein
VNAGSTTGATGAGVSVTVMVTLPNEFTLAPHS